MVGYSLDTKGYRLYQPDTTETIISRNVTFIKNYIKVDDTSTPIALHFVASYEAVEVGVTNNNSERHSDNEEMDQSSTESDLSPIDRGLYDPDYVPSRQVETPITRQLQRKPHPKKLEDYYLYSAIANDMDDPMTLKEALSRPDKQEWQKAIEEEYESL
ncbi:hypothetical protein Trydic_g16346 [Trypoxylus dichotomus]